MFFLQIAGAPVEVQLDGKPGRRLVIPKFLLEDFAVWGNRLRDEQILAATKSLSPQQRAEYLTLYPPMSPTIDELRRSARTPEGIEFIARTCLGRAVVTRLNGEQLPKLTDPEIKALVSGNHRALAALVVELADLSDSSFIKPPPDPDKKENEDPLPPSDRPQ